LPLIAALDQVTKRPLAIRTAYLTYIPAGDTGHLKAELEMLTEDLLYAFKLVFVKKLL
jgi:hypothetical protein